MAATSTNKQPLLVDRVLHYAYVMDTSIIATTDIAGTNTAQLFVNSTALDGAVIEDIYSISRGTTDYKVNLYISSASDYLRPNEGVFIGSFTSATTAGNRTSFDEMPKILAPVAHVGDEPQLKALYVPKGYALWAAIESGTNVNDGPIVGCQGGWY